jgi:hypothetical protein
MSGPVLSAARAGLGIAPASAGVVRLLLVLLVVALAAARPDGVAPARAAEGVAWSADEVRPQFPERIEYRITISSPAAEITDVRLYYGHIQDPIRTQVRPAFTPGRQVAASFTLNTRERYLPPGSEIEYFWSARDATGARYESPRQRFTYMDGRYQWRAKTQGLVTLHWYSGNDAFAQDVLDTAQRTLDRLKQQVGVELRQPVTLIFYGSNADFAQALPPNSAEWIGGQAYPALNLIVAGVRPDGGAAREVRRMVPHELSHIVLHQATDNPYNTPPNWLDEGLAVYNQETPDARFPRIIRDAARTGRLIPLRALNSSFPLDPDEALLSYAQSASVVEFIITQFGPGKAAALTAIFREGVSYDEAVQGALGMTIEELDAQWRAALGRAGAAGGGASAPSASGPNGAPAAGGPDGGLAALIAGAALPLLALAVVVVLAWRARRQDRRARWL